MAHEALIVPVSYKHKSSIHRTWSSLRGTDPTASAWTTQRFKAELLNAGDVLVLSGGRETVFAWRNHLHFGLSTEACVFCSTSCWACSATLKKSSQTNDPMISLTPVVLIHWKGYRPKPKHILGDGKISSKEGMRSSHTGQQTNTWHSHACTTWICRHLFSNSNAFSYIFVSQIRQNSHPSKSMFWAIEGPVLNESSEV